MRLSHPNILPFRGVNTTLFQLALVYDQGENGNIIEYTGSHPDVPRLALVRIATHSNLTSADAHDSYYKLRRGCDTCIPWVFPTEI